MKKKQANYQSTLLIKPFFRTRKCHFGKTRSVQRPCACDQTREKKPDLKYYKMVAGLFTQFLLLTWKNILLQRRKICVTVFEIVLPLVFPIVLIVIRNLSDFKPQLQNATIYETQPIGFEYWSFDDVLYAPNTTLITKIMNNTCQILKGNFSQCIYIYL